MLETTMENVFKQNLLRLRKPIMPRTFGEAVLGTIVWGPKSVPSTPKPVLLKENFSEKVQILESLERFAQEKVKETEVPVIKFDRGEIHLKPEAEWENIGAYKDVHDLRRALQLEPETLDILLGSKSQGAVKVIFVTENFRSYGEAKPELKEGFVNELILGFPLKTAEYFERMIKAMKLEPSEVVIYPVSFQDKDLSEEVMSLTSYFQPEVVITLGASASNKILKNNDRLSNTHGQFFTRKINSSVNFTVVPLFHPTIIENNQNMKKTAWADMQKIMKHLKKLS
jgi:hypothetical protein